MTAIPARSCRRVLLLIVAEHPLAELLCEFAGQLSLMTMDVPPPKGPLFIFGDPLLRKCPASTLGQGMPRGIAVTFQVLGPRVSCTHVIRGRYYTVYDRENLQAGNRNRKFVTSSQTVMQLWELV